MARCLPSSERIVQMQWDPLDHVDGWLDSVRSDQCGASESRCVLLAAPAFAEAPGCSIHDRWTLGLYMVYRRLWRWSGRSCQLRLGCDSYCRLDTISSVTVIAQTNVTLSPGKIAIPRPRFFPRFLRFCKRPRFPRFSRVF